MSGHPQPQPEAARIAHEEADLVRRSLAGDRGAFGALVERYAAAARRVARAVLHDPDDADDAAQDAFLSALTQLHRFDPRRSFGPWLLRIVANAATDRRRRRAVRRTEPLDSAGSPGFAAPRADPAHGPDRETERRLLGERLRAALGELPLRRRLAVVLFDVEGFAHAEIAEILGVPVGTVRSEVFHARRRLRELLADWKEDR